MGKVTLCEGGKDAAEESKSRRTSFAKSRTVAILFLFLYSSKESQYE